MGYAKQRRPLLGAGGFAETVETVTLSTAAQTLSGEGLSLVVVDTSGQANDALIPDPSAVGVRKTIALDNQTTSLEANFNLNSTARTFWGSTFNTITVASTVNDTVAFELVAASTTTWAITAISSTIDWTVSATTGSTGQ